MLSRPDRWITGATLAGTALAACALVLAAPAIAAANPASNTPWPGTTCTRTGTATPNMSASCEALDLPVINAARAHEGVGPMNLPADYPSLSPEQQLFVVTNLERVDRGLPALLGLTNQLDGLAAQGAGHGTDPPFPAGRSWGGSVWGAGYPSVLEADFAWMYNDGLGSDNGACTKAGDAGCWGHRDIILTSASSLTAGAATGYGQWGTEYAVEFIQFPHPSGPYVYTPTGTTPPPPPPAPAPVVHPAGARPVAPARRAAPAAVIATPSPAPTPPRPSGPHAPSAPPAAKPTPIPAVALRAVAPTMPLPAGSGSPRSDLIVGALVVAAMMALVIGGRALRTP